MITREQAKELVFAIGRKYEECSYAELEAMVDRYDGVPPPHEERIGDTVATLQANVDRFRARISVEIFIDAEGMEKWWWRPCYYFERYPSGRIERFDRFGWKGVVLCLFFLFGISSIVYLVIKSFGL